MSLNAVTPFVAPQTQAEQPKCSVPRKAKKRASRNRRNRAKTMDSGPIRSLVPTPVPSIIYPDIPSVVPSPFDTPQHSPRGGSPAPDVEDNPEVPAEPKVTDLSGGGPEELSAALITNAPVYQDDSLDSLSSSSSASSESTKTRTPSIGPTSSSSSSSAHSRSISRSNASNKSNTSARSGRPRSIAAQIVRPHRQRSKSSPNGWYRVTAMEQARKKGRPVKYGVTRDLRVAFMRESGTVKIGKRPAFGCCVIQ